MLSLMTLDNSSERRSANKRSKNLGRKIKTARTHAELTQEELGRRVGLTRQAISYIELTGSISAVLLFEVARQTKQPIEFFQV